MGNHVERKRLFIAGICFLAIVVAVVSAVSFLEYKTYNRKYNEKINALCLELEQKYPDISGSDIMELLNSDETSEENYFRKYGINLEDNSVIKQNEKIFRNYLILNITLSVVGLSLIFGYMFVKNKKRERELSQIAQYLKNINRGDYSFDMEGSSEGELSALESEVYKSTIMLKEAADNSQLDKQRLKDSLSDISHQLKTPITSLVINLENLEDNPDIDIEARNRLIGNAKRDTNRISQMVQQLLTLSKLDANVIEFKKEKTSLSDIVREAMENVAALSDLLEISVVEERCEDADSNIVCDAYWEKQAITNILKNAVEHAKRKVVVRYMNCELYKEIVIENDGNPISDKDRKNIFKRFYSGESSSRDSVGIGLSLANAVVKNDGGYIVVESDENLPQSGVKFIVRYV